MKAKLSYVAGIAAALALVTSAAGARFGLSIERVAAQARGAADFVPRSNGRDLSGWKIPPGDNGHWRVTDKVIDYDAESESSADKSLWSEREFGNFILRAEWRIKDTPYTNPSVPIIRFDGTHKKDATGKEIRIPVPDAESAIYWRGSSKAQVNIWCWPIGSGEVYGYRTDAQ